MEPRNIVICCDGTSNEFAKDLTNVAKLTYALVKDSHRQLVYYHPGLGTMAAPGFAMPIGNRAARIAGLAFGYGIRDDLRDAYIFVMNHWQPGDRLFLFGFSRGSYTVRALASLIRMYGVAMPGNEALVPYAIRMLWGMRGDDRAVRAKTYDQADKFKASLSMADCAPHFVGVWDTVSSVGWVGSPVSLPHTRTNDQIAIFRHAVAIDERRAFFRTNLFQPESGQDAVQLWFPGDHCDVGGGHPEAESGLSKYPLEWMAGQARSAGLLIAEARLGEILGQGQNGYAPARPDARLHDSMTWSWRPAEFAPKPHWDNATGRRGLRCNLFRRRNMLTAPKVHRVAWEIPGYSDRLPADAVRV